MNNAFTGQDIYKIQLQLILIILKELSNFGSSSVGYGSDAMGGVIHYYTKDLFWNLQKSASGFTTITHLQINLSLITLLLTIVKKIGGALRL